LRQFNHIFPSKYWFHSTVRCFQWWYPHVRENWSNWKALSASNCPSECEFESNSSLIVFQATKLKNETRSATSDQCCSLNSIVRSSGSAKVFINIAWQCHVARFQERRSFWQRFLDELKVVIIYNSHDCEWM
jgi:hypothetical protein